jgi:hypothetical protein
MANSKAVRDYAPAWLELKKHNTVKLKVAPHLLSRVKKAIIKEKDMDTTYKVQQEVQGKPKMLLRSNYNSETWVLELRLVVCKTIEIHVL